MAPKQAATTKRSRATAEQLRVMVDLLGETPGLASGRFQRMHGKLENEKKWKELAVKLNAVGGAVKSVEQWMTVWRDLKGRTSGRVRDRNNEQAQTGNRPISVAPLTETEKRIVDLIGDNYVEGARNCEDSAMDEELNLVMEDEEYLLEIDAISEVPSDCEVQNPPATSSSQRCAAATPTTPATASRTPATAPRTPATAPRTPATSTRTPAQTPRRGAIRRNNGSEREDRFLAIAEKQADTMRMLAENQIKLAENQQKQTEATLAMAKAIEANAKAIEANAKAIETNAKAIQTMGEGLKVCAEAFNQLSAAIITKDGPGNN